MKRKGFTLIELVMVIVIIGILAAIAIPRFISLRSDARQAACDGNASTIRSSLSAYYAKTAITTGFDAAGRAASGFPLTLNVARFIGSFFAVGTLPVCPGSQVSATYANRYTSSTGVLAQHITSH